MRCDFCEPGFFGGAEILIEDDLGIYASSETLSKGEPLPGAGLAIPRAHRETPFDLTADEWLSMRSLVTQAKAIVDDRWHPDGYNVGWNIGPVGGQEVAHVHLHLIPRFADEPYAGRGIRWWLKQPENRR